jgi:hypothetical protein
MAMPEATGGAALFVGIVSDVPVSRVVIHDVPADFDRVGIDHVWLGKSRQGYRDDLWRMRWFRCEFGDANDFVLQRDGAPVCGSANCPSPPPACWGRAVTARSWSEEGISWATIGGGCVFLIVQSPPR